MLTTCRPTRRQLQAAPEPLRVRYARDPQRWGCAVVDTVRQLEHADLPHSTPAGAWVVRSQLLAEWTGYGQAAIALARELGRTTPVRLWGDITDERYIPFTPWVRERATGMGSGVPALAVGTPRWPDDWTGPQLTMWEPDRLPPEHVARLNRRPLVIVPTDWQRRTFRASGVRARLEVCPLGIDPAIYRVRPLPEGGPFVVLTGGRVSHGGTRKGHGLIAEAFALAFPGRDDVRLRVKVWPDCRREPEWREPTDPRVIVDDAPLDDPGMADWYGSGHVFASGSAGEGWGLMHHQAMATGRPVVGTSYGATAAMVGRGRGWAVPHRMVPAPGGDPYHGAGRWALMRVEDVARALVEAERDRAELGRRARRAAEWAHRHTWARSGERLRGLLRSAGLETPAEPPLPSVGRMVGGAVASAAQVAASGGELASDDEQARRWAECRACDQFRPSDRRCGGVSGCGCFLELKIPLAATSCPVGRW
jgi:glycosyltransferase involved in cell wall biosynthesis